ATWIVPMHFRMRIAKPVTTTAAADMGTSRAVAWLKKLMRISKAAMALIPVPAGRRHLKSRQSNRVVRPTDRGQTPCGACPLGPAGLGSDPVRGLTPHSLYAFRIPVPLRVGAASELSVKAGDAVHGGEGVAQVAAPYFVAQLFESFLHRHG